MQYHYWQAILLWKQKKYKASLKQFVNVTKSKWKEFNTLATGYRFGRTVLILIYTRDFLTKATKGFFNYFIHKLNEMNRPVKCTSSTTGSTTAE